MSVVGRRGSDLRQSETQIIKVTPGPDAGQPTSQLPSTMAAVKIFLLSALLAVFIADSLAQTCSAANKKCGVGGVQGECCSKCCLGSKCVDANQCAPKCPPEVEFKCKSAAQECFLKPVTNCPKQPCKPEPACRYIPPCNRLTCPKGKHCVDIGGTPPTSACQPDPKPAV